MMEASELESVVMHASGANGCDMAGHQAGSVPGVGDGAQTVDWIFLTAGVKSVVLNVQSSSEDPLSTGLFGVDA